MAKQEFKLRKVIEGSVTPIRMNPAQGGGTFFLNRGTQDVKAPNSVYDGLKVATAEDLQRVYDNGPEGAKLVQAPSDHKAPWQQDQTAKTAADSKGSK